MSTVNQVIASLQALVESDPKTGDAQCGIDVDGFFIAFDLFNAAGIPFEGSPCRLQIESGTCVALRWNEDYQHEIVYPEDEPS